MPALSISAPFPIFTDVDGNPLEDGYIFIGAVNQNPEAVPIAAFWDAALTIPAAQPIRTLGGYPSRSGTPARIYVNADDFSISVKNKNSTLIYSALSDTQRLPFSTITGVVDSQRVEWDRIPLTESITTVEQILSAARVNLWEYADLVVTKPTLTDPSTWDWSPAIQGALDALGAARGGLLLVPEGIFQHSATITVPKFVYVHGAGSSYLTTKGTVFHYTGVNDGWQIDNPINSVNPVHCNFSDVTFYAPNLGSTKGAFADNGSIQVSFDRCSFLHNAVGVGLIFDQTEISHVNRCYFEALGTGGGGCMWIVNGDSRRVGALKQFTNEITVFNCNINPADSGARGIIDDGGISHKFIFSNFNGGAIQIVAQEVNGLTIDSNEMEASTVAAIRIQRPGGAVATPTATITENFILLLAGSVGVDISPATMDSLNYHGNIFSGTTSDSILDVGKVNATGNVSISGGSSPTNTYDLDGSKSSTLAGSSVAGAHTYLARTAYWNRNGSQVALTLNMTLNVKDAAMAGDVEIDCLPYIAASDFQGMSLGFYTGITVAAGFTQIAALAIPGTTKVRLYKSGSAQSGTALQASEISTAFSISMAGSYIAAV